VIICSFVSMREEGFGRSLLDVPVRAHIEKVVWNVSKEDKRRNWNFNSYWQWH